ncbi:MAG: DUF4296 domain-containing protein [Prevotellaceae bacterium]|jgi:hypothetical protein|nr:DUF4296 domain-containing protein [Prevotellaceae bacterium]
MKFSKQSVFFILLLLAAGACHNRIPPQTMAGLLADFHLYGELPGELARPLKDSASLSLSLFEKYDVSQEQFRATLQYYAAHPKKMKALYEQIDSLMKERVALYQQAVEENEIARNRWLGRECWDIDTVQRPESILFHIPIDTVGNFTMKVCATLYADDSTRQPSMTGYFLTKIAQGVRDTINRKTILFTPSGHAQTYTLSFSTTDARVNAFEGYWLQVKDDTAARRQHLRIEKIRLLHDNDSTLYISSDVRYPKILKGGKPSPTQETPAVVRRRRQTTPLRIQRDTIRHAPLHGTDAKDERLTTPLKQDLIPSTTP